MVLDSKSQNMLKQILSLFHHNINLTIKNKKMYIFIKEEFNCFNSYYYSDGSLPKYNDYTKLLEIENSIKELLNLLLFLTSNQ